METVGGLSVTVVSLPENICRVSIEGRVITGYCAWFVSPWTGVGNIPLNGLIFLSVGM